MINYYDQSMYLKNSIRRLLILFLRKEDVTLWFYTMYNDRVYIVYFAKLFESLGWTGYDKIINEPKNVVFI